MTKKLTYEYVKEYVENTGCKLLSEEYINNSTKLTIEFVCGHIYSNKTFQDFIKTEKVCPKCRISKIDYGHVEELFKKNGYLLLTDNFINDKQELIFSDVDGYKYNETYRRFYTNIWNGDTPPRFSKLNKFALDNIILFLSLFYSTMHLKEFQRFKNTKEKMIFYDNDGYYYSSSFDKLRQNVKRGNSLRKFDKNNIFTLQNISKWIKLKNKNYLLVDGQTYEGDRSILKFKCLVCKDDEDYFYCSWNRIQNGAGCKICSGNQVGKYNSLEYKFPDISKEFDIEKNFPITPNQITTGITKKFWWICEKCKLSYFSSPNSRCGNQTGCPRCRESKGEIFIRKTLEQYKFNNEIINFNHQYVLNDCKDILVLPFDFAVWGKYDLFLIEYQGSQHTKSFKFFGGNDKFEIQQRHDQIKRDYCKNNNIKLIEIDYKDLKNIPDILSKELLEDKEVK